MAERLAPSVPSGLPASGVPVPPTQLPGFGVRGLREVAFQDRAMSDDLGSGCPCH